MAARSRQGQRPGRVRRERDGDEQALQGFAVQPAGSRAVSVLYSSHGGAESGRARRRRGKLWRGDGPPQTAVESKNDATGEEERTIGEKQRRQVAQQRQADATEEGADKGSEQEQLTEVVATYHHRQRRYFCRACRRNSRTQTSVCWPFCLQTDGHGDRGAPIVKAMNVSRTGSMHSGRQGAILRRAGTVPP